MRATLIVNPYASSVTEERVHAVERELGAAYELQTVLTEHRGHATELAARAAEGDAIFVFGGDGAFNEVLNGADVTRPLGFVPGGGTNVLPRALGLPRDPVATARRLVSAHPRRISLGRANGRRFAFGAGIGLDSRAVRRVDELGRGEDGRRPGDWAFFRAVLGIVASSGWRLRDGLELKGSGRQSLVVVSNDAVFTYAGPRALRFSPEARFELGLDVAALSDPGAVTIAFGFFGAAFGRGLAGLPRSTAGHDLDRIEVVCDRPSPLQADGEDLGDVTEVLFECERDAVSVLA
ncbi:MAG TPA: diacylglycerol kinase family protein [Gaiellaceae bacterium]|nr:diacylglycerol kinase family protein [Gaiellaceae bacterium]